ncbi:MAG: CHASE domain-containing protein [Sphingobacteriaceae bacterium]|nr:CHASE domain-containing protein [Sphingobacteriaceae bacterium]
MKFKSFIKIYYPAVLILIALLSFTLYAWLEASADYKARTNKLFEQRAFRVGEIIGNRMVDYSQILRGCQALFDSSKEISVGEWETYVRGLKVAENYPGIQGLAVSRYVAASDSSKVSKELRGLNLRYKITSPFEYPVIVPVLYIEPFNKRNERAIGFDLYSEARRRDAIKRAITTREPSITRKIKLRQETHADVQPGFLMFLPIFSDTSHTRVAGFVANVFRTHDLMGALLNRYSEVDLQLYDGTTLSEKHLIYEKTINSSSYNRLKGPLVFDTTLVVAGLPWRLIVSPNENFGSTIERQQPFLILAVGVILSVLLFVVSYNNIRRKGRIGVELQKTLALEKKKDEFISIASHELKTPLTSIKASIQLLERADLKERDKFMLAKAGNNVDKLQALIGDLLDISKIQAGQLQLNKEDFKLSALIRDCIESVGHIYSSHKIEILNIIPDLIYHGDKFRLEQALNNLFINAIKYSPGSEKVFVDMGLSQGIIKIKIIDEGIGISEQNIKKIFDRFFRAEELSPVISGLGIGLHISNEIIKRHGGSITVTSELNQGSIFTIIL